jgi:D-arabinose 1-dehydrogenase-like Zn-dependent alcohol dehydrogenase
MRDSYKAVEATKPGSLRVLERPIPRPSRGQVLIRVQACGVCHTDSLTVEGAHPAVEFPRVPGHEVAGLIEAVGPEVSRWQVGQRVGVGFFGGQDGTCDSCRRGDFINCEHLIFSGLTTDGGYAEVMIAEARALVSIPEELTSVDAAPLLDAGVTTYNALRNARLRAGDLVAVQGIGGVGHLGVQYARHMGFRTVAIARGADKERVAIELGAHSYIDSTAVDPAVALQRLGGAAAILATAASSSSMGPLLAGLRPRGQLIVVGVTAEPIEVKGADLVFGVRSMTGALTGTPADIADMLAFSVMEEVRPVIEEMPLDQAPEAYARMMSGHARLRVVLTTGQ